MAYKILGTKSETARIIIFKEADWSIESNTVVVGSGAYEIDSLETGNKLIVAESGDGELLGYGNVTPIEYAEPQYHSIFDNTKWETSVYETPNGTWSTDEWDASYSFGYRVRIVPTGGWEVGLRPTKMRLTWNSNYTGSENDVYLTDGYLSANVIGVDYSNESGDEIALDFDGCGDIGELYMTAADIGDRDFQITNIEFYY